MRCVKCGKNIRKITWAVYADEAFAGKALDPLPLHNRCFKDSETITAAHWVQDDDGAPGSLKLQETEQLRYREVPEPGIDEEEDFDG